MDQLHQIPAWPAAPRSGLNLISHPAWEGARNAVLDLAAEGPVTVFLTGEPGTGKTWLLRELAACLAAHGFPTMTLMRGDLPVPLGDGVAVLVDEARYMPEATRAALAVQDRGVVVLADVGPLGVERAEAGRAPAFLHLRLLDAAEIGPFAMDWLGAELPSVTLDPDAVPRLAEHSGGAVRLVVQLLAAAIALSRVSGEQRLTAELIDQVAALRLGALMSDIEPAPGPDAPAPSVAAPPSARPEPVVMSVPTPASPVPVRRAKLRWTVTGTALAASVLAVAMVPGLRQRAPNVGAALPAPQLPPVQAAQNTAPELALPVPPIVVASREMGQPAIPAASVLADRAVPAPARSAAPSTTRDALPPLQATDVPALAIAATTAQPIGIAEPPALVSTQLAPSPVALSPIATPPIVRPPPVVPMPVAVASVAKPVTVPIIASEALAPALGVARPSTAGLVFVARPGDTLERLYTAIYHDRRAPPLAEVQAVNPSKLKPGAILVFPEPTGGWGRTQR